MKKIALKSDHKSFKHCTLVIRGGSIISASSNLKRIHSEVRAVNKLWPSKRRDCTIVNIMIRKNNTLGNSRPCNDCIEFLRSNGIYKVVYFNGTRFLIERF